MEIKDNQQHSDEKSADGLPEAPAGSKPSIKEAFQELRDIAGEDFDRIEDVDKFFSDIRSSD